MADLAGIETFVAVARLGSVQRAAERLNRAQPSLSARLAGLEEAWRTRLFRRHARGMALTPEGARLLPLAEGVLKGLDALAAAAGLPLSGKDELRLGSGDALGRETVPRALAKLLAGEPRISARVFEGPAAQLLERLRAGEIDLALVPSSAPGTEGGGLALEPLLTSAVDALFPAGGRPPSAGIGIRQLAERRLVTLQPGSEFRRHIEKAFAAAGLPFRPAVEVGNLSLVRRFVAAGLGAGLVPAVAFAKRPLDSTVVRRRVLGVPPIAYASARREGVPLSAVSRRFVELVSRNS